MQPGQQPGRFAWCRRASWAATIFNHAPLTALGGYWLMVSALLLANQWSMPALTALVALQFGSLLVWFCLVRAVERTTQIPLAVARPQTPEPLPRVAPANSAIEALEQANSPADLGSIDAALRRAMDATDIGIALVDQDLRYAYANASYARSTGDGSAAALIGRTVAEVLGADRARRCGQDVIDAHGGKRIRREYDLTAADGTVSHLLASIEPISTGPSAYVLVSILDHTEVRVREERSKQDAERLQMALDAGQVGTWRWWRADDNFDLDQRAKEIFDISESRVHGDALAAKVHPEDQSWIHEKLRDRLHALNPPDAICLEHRIVTTAGDVRWVRVQVKLQGPEGEWVIGTWQDVTETRATEDRLRRSEERLRLASEDAGFGVFEFDVAHMRGEITEGLQRLIGRDGKTTLGLEEALLLVHGEDRGRAWEDWNRILRTPGRFELEGRLLQPNGTARHVVNRGEAFGPVSPETNLVQKVRGTVIDITELKRAQEAVEAHRRAELIGQLAGGVAHDLNNLLTVISGNLQLAADSSNPERTRHWINLALAAVERGSAFNRRLLGLARRNVERAALVAPDERVTDIINMLVRTFEPNIKFASDLASETWPVLVDPGDLDSALINLAVNARDAMAEGGAIRIATRNCVLSDATAIDPDARPGEYVVITVKDQGSGMTPEVLQRCRQPFFTTKPSGKGWGIGLSSVDSFARRAGGFLHIESEPGKGTSASIYLPRPTVDAMARRQGAEDHRETIRGRNQTILLAEDDEHVRQVTGELIENLGFTVLQASTGAAAIECLRSNPTIALVVSDVVMPGGMSGYDVQNWVSGNYPGLPVILVSGYDPAEISAPNTVRQSAVLLRKPYTQRELANEIARALADPAS